MISSQPIYNNQLHRDENASSPIHASSIDHEAPATPTSVDYSNCEWYAHAIQSLLNHCRLCGKHAEFATASFSNFCLRPAHQPLAASNLEILPLHMRIAGNIFWFCSNSVVRRTTVLPQTSKMPMTLATAWVKRGFATEFPQKYSVDEAELGRIEKLARLQLQDAQEDLNEAQMAANGPDHESEGSAEQETGRKNNNGTKAPVSNDDDDLKEYHLSDYDEDEKEADGEKFAMLGNVRSLAYHAPGEEDPYLTLPEGDQDSDDEREDLQILSTDNLILAAKVEDEVAHLEVFVYEDDSDNLYVHQDIMLPAIPLCVEWIGASVGKDAGNKSHGNFAAVGTIAPEIEVWDLDIVDSLYPTMILGQEPEDASAADRENLSGKKKKSKKKQKPKANDEYHVDAVLAIASNKHHGNLLASASADKTVKLWDLNSGKCAKSYNMHNGKVCALDWHPTEPTILLSGSYDRSVIATDMRAPDAQAPKWIVEADVEKVRWDIHNPQFFYVTTENGTVHYFDAQNPPSSYTTPSKPVWTLQAHDSAVSAFDINPRVPGYLATGSEDKKVKLWNVQDNKPGMVVSRNLEVGRVFSVQFGPDTDVAFRLSVAGSKGQVQVWDTSTNAAVRNAFANRVKMPDTVTQERFITVNKDDDEDESEDDDADDDGGVATGADGWESMDED